MIVLINVEGDLTYFLFIQTLLITEVILPNESPLHLALVQWYEFKHDKTPFVYGCPLLKLVDKYTFIEVEAIEEIVHIVPCFDKENKEKKYKK